MKHHYIISRELLNLLIRAYNRKLMDEQMKQKLMKFFSQYKQMKFKKGELIIKADEQPSGVFFIENGIVAMYAVSANGEEMVINTFKPSAFFPMGWVLNDTKLNYYYEAKLDVTVWRAPKEDFLAFLKSEPDVVFDLIKRIYKGLDGYFMRMEFLMSGNAKSRLITELLIYVKRFGEIKDNKAVVSLKLTEKDLAAHSGIARETVSRELQKLKEKKLISIESKTLTIYDIENLEAELAK